MKKMISFALALIMVLVLVACGDNPASNGGNTQNETVTLRASTPTAPEHPWSKCLDNIAAQIKEKTNGRYQIDVYYNASLSESSEKTMTEQIMTGTLDLGISPAPLVGKAFSAFSFPFQFDDRDHIIAWHSTISFINDNCPIEIPYRAILPKKTENLLCPGRHISADELGIDYVNLIPQCVGTGQAAGVAAAVAIADGTTAHKVNIKKVQDILARDQDVPLPRNPYTDPSYMQNVVDHEYGLYTQLAKNAREKAGYLSGVRQFGANQGEIVDSDSKSIKGGGDAQLNPDLIKATPQH